MDTFSVLDYEVSGEVYELIRGMFTGLPMVKNRVSVWITIMFVCTAVNWFM